MHRTRNDLSARTRSKVTALLGERLTDAVALRLAVKQAHWNVKGPGFMELHELFDEIDPDAYQVATAIELFHNFSLIHDDIMDKAPLRRGEHKHAKELNDVGYWPCAPKVRIISGGRCHQRVVD